MKKYAMVVRSLAAVALLSLLLTSCTSGGKLGNETPDVSPTPATSPAVGEVPTYPVPLENRNVDIVWGICPSSQGDGHYRIGNVVMFCDAKVGGLVVLCAQPGCEHKDETCQAWIGDVEMFAEYHGDIYAIRGDHDVEFVRKDLTDGSITVLGEWKATDTTYYYGHMGRIADGQITILLQVNERVDPNLPDITQSEQILLIDVETGEQRRIFQGEEEHIFGIQAHSRDYAVVRYWDTSKSQRLSLEEYMAQYGGGEDEYWGYVLDTEYYELRLYDRNTGEYRVLTDTNQGYYPTVDPNTTYGYDVVYVVGDGVFLVNAETGQTRQLLTQEGIINYFLLDHRVFFVTRDGDEKTGPIKIWHADISDGTPVQLENDGNAEHAVYGLRGEGESFFIDYKGVRLSKQDFYAENYENVF